ncbi:MAG: hypothetical protein H6734_18850 [Alphaproteobacteria bacterium]|nr:hypothetical protein [Alphaproteobacteria bacterium]
MTIQNRFLSVLGILALVGCNDPQVDPGSAATVRGSITDANGTQARLAGSGSVDAATRVQAMEVANDGSLTVVSEADIQADGSFTVDVPAETEHVVLVAVDDAGERVGTVWVEMTGEVGTTTDAAPIDSETSLETEVMLSAAARSDLRDLDTVDLRKRVSGTMATRVRAMADAEAQTEIDVLADAFLAAQSTRVMAFADAGYDLEADELREVKLATAADLDADLTAGQRGQSTVDGFLDASLAAESSLGIDAKAAADAESQASIAFRSVVRERGSAEVEGAASANAGLLEAWTTDAYAGVIAEELDANASARLTLAGQDLKAGASASTNVAATAAAFDAWESELVDPDTGVVAGLTIALPLVDIDAVVDGVIDATVDLDATLDADIAATGDDPDAVATVVTDAWADFRADVEASATTSVFTDADVAAELLVIGTGGFAAD